MTPPEKRISEDVRAKLIDLHCGDYYTFYVSYDVHEEHTLFLGETKSYRQAERIFKKKKLDPEKAHICLKYLLN